MRAAVAMLAEFCGTALLVCAVVGSGMMGDALSNDVGITLIINAISTVLVLALLIMLLAPISGAQLNPAVSLVECLRRRLPVGRLLGYVAAQIAGAIVGTVLANVMFGHPALEWSTTDRFNPGNLIGEVIATAGLIVVIVVLGARKLSGIIPIAVAAWIGTAYFFTASTSFANPAVTISRMFTGSFTGIAPESVLPFVGAQFIGALIGLGLAVALIRAETLTTE